MVAVSACQSQVEDKIVLINVEDYDKIKISKLISSINMLNPKVISLDIALPEYTGDLSDKMLYQALLNTKKLILPSEISSEGLDYHGNEVISVYLTFALEFFVPRAKTGFVSVKVDKGQTQIPRQFIVWQKGSYSEDIYNHFSVVTAMAFDSLKASKFIRTHERMVDINYKKGNRKFRVFSASEVLKGKLSVKDIKGKIIMMGFLGPGDQDKFSVAFNSSSNKTDIYGLEYLAIILAQVLENQ